MEFPCYAFWLCFLQLVSFKPVIKKENTLCSNTSDFKTQYSDLKEMKVMLPGLFLD